MRAFMDGKHSPRIQSFGVGRQWAQLPQTRGMTSGAGSGTEAGTAADFGGSLGTAAGAAGVGALMNGSLRVQRAHAAIDAAIAAYTARNR